MTTAIGTVGAAKLVASRPVRLVEVRGQPPAGHPVPDRRPRARSVPVLTDADDADGVADQPDHLPRAGRPARARQRRQRGHPLRRHLVPEHPAGARRPSTSTRRRTTSTSTTSTPSSTAASSVAARPARRTRCSRATPPTAGSTTDKRQPQLPLRRPRQPVPQQHQDAVRLDATGSPASPTTQGGDTPSTLTIDPQAPGAVPGRLPGQGGRRRPTAASPVSGSSRRATARTPSTCRSGGTPTRSPISSASRRSRWPLRSGRRSTPSWRTSPGRPTRQRCTRTRPSTPTTRSTSSAPTRRR